MRDDTLEIIESARRRGWYVSHCEDIDHLTHEVRNVPTGGILLLEAGIFADRNGIAHLTQLASLPVLPHIYLLADVLDVTVLAVREISIAAGIDVLDILIRPLSGLTLDRLLGA